MIEAYKRLRHAYGFGVHSPFAYDLIKTVVTPGKYSYYGYSDIDREILKPGTEVYPTLRNDARFLLRLLVFLRPSELLLYPSKQPIFATAAKAVGVKVASESLPKRSLLLIYDKAPKSGWAAQNITDGIAILAFNPSPQLRDEIKAAMTDGLVLEGRHTFLAIPRPEMAMTYYSVKM